MKAPYSKVPALPPVLGLCAGIFVYTAFGVSLWWAAFLAAAGGAIGFTFKRWWEAFVLLFAALGICLCVAYRQPAPPQQLVGERVMLEGRVVHAEESTSAMNYIVDVDHAALAGDSLSGKCRFRLELTVSAFDRVFYPGDRIAVMGKLQSAHDIPDVPDKIDYNARFASYGATARMWTVHTDIALEKSEPTLLERTARNVREILAEAIVTSGVNDDTASFLLTVLIGDDSLMCDSLDEDFRNAGLAHILALSGLHLSILIALMTMVLVYIKSVPGGRTAFYLIPAVAALAYAFITGMSPSVCRAAVMVDVFLIGRLLQRKVYPFNFLCVTVFIWLVINPLWFFSMGFQLSVLSVAALLWLNTLMERYPDIDRRLRAALMLVAVPLVCVIAGSTLTIFYFHEFPVYFLLANILAGFFIVPFLALGAVLTLLSLCGIKLYFLAAAEDFLFSLLHAVAECFGNIPGGVVEGLYPNFWQSILWAATSLCLLWAIACRAGQRRVALTALCISTISLALGIILEKPSRGNEIYITADKQSTRILIQSDNHALLILPTAAGDTAMQRDVLQRASVEYRDYLGKRRIDSLSLAPADFRLGDFTKRGPLLTFGSKTLYILSTDTIPPAAKVDYLLVCRGFRGDVVEAAQICRAGETIISADINATRRSRYCRELTEAGLPNRDAAAAPFALPQK